MPYKIKIIGVYIIKNKSNNNCYIGSSCNLYKRLNEHKLQLRKNKHINYILQRAWNKYGKENFEFEVLEICSKEDLLIVEQKYINNIKPKYNILKNATRAGFKVSKKSIEKFIKTNRERHNFKKGRKCLPEEMDRFMRLCHGDNHPNRKLTKENILYIKEEYKNKNYKQHELAAKFNVGQDHISRIINNKVCRVDG